MRKEVYLSKQVNLRSGIALRRLTSPIIEPWKGYSPVWDLKMRYLMIAFCLKIFDTYDLTLSPKKLLVASHNEQSSLLMYDMLQKKPDKVKNVLFAQLYGLADQVTFLLKHKVKIFLAI